MARLPELASRLLLLIDLAGGLVRHILLALDRVNVTVLSRDLLLLPARRLGAVLDAGEFVDQLSRPW